MAINIAPKSLDTELSELMRDVTSGKAQLPEFQRSWTWDDGRIRVFWRAFHKDILWVRLCAWNAGMKM